MRGAAARVSEGARPLLVPVSTGTHPRVLVSGRVGAVSPNCGQAGGLDTKPSPHGAAWPMATSPTATAGRSPRPQGPLHRGQLLAAPLHSRFQAHPRAASAFPRESARAQTEKEMEETTVKLLTHGHEGDTIQRAPSPDRAGRAAGAAAAGREAGVTAAHPLQSAEGQLESRPSPRRLGDRRSVGEQTRRREKQRDPRTPKLAKPRDAGGEVPRPRSPALHRGRLRIHPEAS